ncbi:putative gamma-glutamyl phosphate reductase [Viridothelium virens]|uniref:glutamate-5-semialdehyde dehydrogenase n=1 Tax=Viridothelium virens TaxID=1048519 RepID=A0A6A6GYF2_VIRVR|nr:putative gamma-glutamyl phosphate reductase [Viridothelium virens]
MSLTNASPIECAKAARIASRKLAILSTQERNDALTAIHNALAEAKESILMANKCDLVSPSDASEKGELSQSILKRLDLGRPGKWEDMLQGILDVRRLEDPIGKVDHRMELDDGLICQRKSCPIGVLLIIFEARPEVIANIASLAIKSGNAAILKGGSETSESFKTISTVISHALTTTVVPNDALQLVTTREAIQPLLQLDKYIDLVIPRGSNSLVSYCKKNSTIPILGHADGLCIIYLCADADKDQAVRVVIDSKTNYPAACNSVETLLVDSAALTTHLPAVAEALLEKGVRLRCDAESLTALQDTLDAHQAAFLTSATSDDYMTEFLDLTLAIKTIPASSSSEKALDAAVTHINTYSSHHTDAILTSSSVIADTFCAAVDSACVFVNTSTRMADGQRFGFGTEVGISTNKIHARGPVGLEGLTIYKYEVRGKGQVAGDYGGKEGRQWKHRMLPLEEPA